MDRGHTKPFQKRGPKAQREILRDAEAIVEENVEKYVREKMKPELLKNAHEAVSWFQRKRG